MEARARKGSHVDGLHEQAVYQLVVKRCKTRVRGFVNSHIRTGR
jgi:hypothetical protein